MADQYNIKFFETSAKSSANVAEAFITLATDVMMRLEATVPEEKAETTQTQNNFKVGPKPAVNKSNCICSS